jgi:hypothetical protein
LAFDSVLPAADFAAAAGRQLPLGAPPSTSISGVTGSFDLFESYRRREHHVANVGGISALRAHSSESGSGSPAVGSTVPELSVIGHAASSSMVVDGIPPLIHQLAIRSMPMMPSTASMAAAALFSRTGTCSLLPDAIRHPFASVPHPPQVPHPSPPPPPFGPSAAAAAAAAAAAIWTKHWQKACDSSPSATTATAIPHPFAGALW